MPDIARDAATDGGNNGGTTTSRTFAHTCSGSGRYLFVPVKGGLVSDGDLVTGGFNASFHMTAGAAPTTHVVDDVNFGTWSFFDSDGPVGTGSQSLEGVGSGVSDGLNGIIAALKPDTGTPVALLLGQEMM